MWEGIDPIARRPPPASRFAAISTTAGFRAAYDPNGNMVLRVDCRGEPCVRCGGPPCSPITYTQEYDAENRLAVVTNTVTGEVVHFVYDGDGNRVLRIGPEGTMVYIGDYHEAFYPWAAAALPCG